ncbi:hypothetical protein [Actinacidiphila sp. bgisy167]|uniref:hypothetical protein n=1 Tax=Actinacidiphila sp. bgisy167 TaxID=3413797 RepID=UPI003D74570C
MIDGVEVRRLRWNPLGWAYLTASDRDAGASLRLAREGWRTAESGGTHHPLG